MSDTVFLEDVCDILDSQRIPITSTNRKKGIYPYYGANGIQDYVDNYIFDDELVLLAEDGGNFGSTEKPIAYRVSGKCWVNNHAHVLKAKECIDIDYLCYSLMFYDVSSLINGATRQKLNQAAMRKMKIPLPPLEEQKQIAATLDKVTHTIDTCNAILEKLDLLVKSRFIEVFGSITKRRKLEEYADLITKGASPKWQGIDYAEEGTLFVTSENVREGYLDFTKKKYLPNDINKILPRSVLKRNDILINIVNASIGRVAVYDSDELANINQAVALVRLKPNALNITFLLTFLNSEEALRAYDFMKVGGDKANLSLKNISDLLIPVADLELQEKFATFVEQIDKSKLAVKQVLEKAETLKKALMQEYFG